jgi:hypothetical protein
MGAYINNYISRIEQCYSEAGKYSYDLSSNKFDWLTGKKENSLAYRSGCIVAKDPIARKKQLEDNEWNPANVLRPNDNTKYFKVNY